MDSRCGNRSTCFRHIHEICHTISLRRCNDTFSFLSWFWQRMTHGYALHLMSINLVFLYSRYTNIFYDRNSELENVYQSWGAWYHVWQKHYIQALLFNVSHWRSEKALECFYNTDVMTPWTPDLCTRTSTYMF